MDYQRPKGTNDFCGAEARVMEGLIREGSGTLRHYGFEPITTPIFEHTELFTRSVGEETDIVSKEMYTFHDRKDRSLTLRPEGTAGAVRAWLENGLERLGVNRLYYAGPFFRYERPQAGRYRQFHQLGAEILGDPTPGADAELIDSFCALVEGLGLEGLVVEVNSVGCPECRPTFSAALRQHLASVAEGLCEDCRRRLEKNPLRVLDCKVESCRERLVGSPTVVDSLCAGCRGHHDAVLAALRALGLAFHENPRLVRGLDYYTRTAFEVTCNRLGSQNAVGGGGRYDGLIQQLGGRPTPATGYAIGLERLASLLPDAARQRCLAAPTFMAAFASSTPAGKTAALGFASKLRRLGLAAHVDHVAQNLGKQLGRAAKAGATVAVILGEDELARGAAAVKDLATGQQADVPLAGLLEELRRRGGR